MSELVSVRGVPLLRLVLPLSGSSQSFALSSLPPRWTVRGRAKKAAPDMHAVAGAGPVSTVG